MCNVLHAGPGRPQQSGPLLPAYCGQVWLCANLIAPGSPPRRCFSPADVPARLSHFGTRASRFAPARGNESPFMVGGSVTVPFRDNRRTAGYAAVGSMHHDPPQSGLTIPRTPSSVQSETRRSRACRPMRVPAAVTLRGPRANTWSLPRRAPGRAPPLRGLRSATARSRCRTSCRRTLCG